MNDLCGGECDVHDDPRRENVNESVNYGEYDVHDDLWIKNEIGNALYAGE